MIAFDALLERLQGVQRCGDSRARAICPAHTSRHATRSLSIRELPDGTLLLNCFFGCGAVDIVSAVGLQLRDLFPVDHRAPQEGRPAQRPSHWHSLADALRTLADEALLVVIAAESLAQGVALTARDRDRLLDAASKLRAAARACL